MQYRNIYNKDELYHFGILGMKWGVRRYQDKSGKLTAAGKQRRAENEANGHGDILGKSRDEDITIEAGTKAYRVQGKKDLTGEGQSFISLDKLDHMKYLQAAVSKESGVALDAIDTNGNNGRPYSVRLELSNDLIMPSYNKTMEAFVKTVNDVGVSSISGLMPNQEEASKFVKDFSNKKVEQARDDAYVAFVGTFMKDSTARRAFYNTLQSQGYNAIVDDFDVQLGKAKYAKTSVIVFDKQKDLKQKESVAISDRDADYFLDIYNREYTNKDRETHKKWDDWTESKDYRKQAYPEDYGL